MTTINTFGDSILDCGTYNDRGITPGALMSTNDDTLYPEFRGRDLSTALGHALRVVARATDGATVGDLRRQLRGHRPAEGSVVLLTIGGNDLLQGLSVGTPQLLRTFEQELRHALSGLTRTDLFVGNVYDPSFGDDARNFLEIDPVVARRAHAGVNAILAAEAASAGGSLVDLHAHFLTGDPSWFTRTIEPSLVGASEVRRAFLATWESARSR